MTSPCPLWCQVHHLSWQFHSTYIEIAKILYWCAICSNKTVIWSLQSTQQKRLKSKQNREQVTQMHTISTHWAKRQQLSRTTLYKTKATHVLPKCHFSRVGYVQLAAKHMPRTHTHGPLLVEEVLGTYKSLMAPILSSSFKRIQMKGNVVGPPGASHT
jgi:hypothetical protein